MATYTTIGICNKALLLCGASPIASLSEDSANARSLNAVYEISRQDFLTECRWNFAVTRSTLATVATSVMAYMRPEEAYVYTKPAGVLRIWEMSDIEAIWREEGGYIITDRAGLGALWTFDNSEVGLWSPKPIMAFIDKLCSDIAYQIINSIPKAESFLSKYTKISLPAAMAENSQTGAHQEVRDNDWLNARGGGGSASRSYD